MLDVFHLPPHKKADIKMFTDPSPVANTQWSTWRKPRGASMIYIFCVGGGAGGGGGASGAAGSGRLGGGGGGSSPITRVLMPAIFVPDILYIEVGAGGDGSAAGGTGGNGVRSYVAVAPNTTASNVIAVSANGVPGGGGTGGGGGGGTGAAITAMPLAGMGFIDVVASQSGADPGSGIAIPVTSLLCQGGASGANVTTTDTAPAGFTAIANSYLSEQRPATPAAGTNGHGSGGRNTMVPFFSFGGGGGASSNASPGAHGGDGVWGSGGGGGGGGTTGGRGGRGGDGVVIIIAW